MRNKSNIDEDKLFINDTVIQLKKGNKCYVFNRENLEKITKKFEGLLIIEKIDYYWLLTPENKQKG